MHILIVHNHYQESGGEDQVFASEGDLLEAHGHSVQRFTLHNENVACHGRLRLAGKTVWSGAAFKQLRRIISTHQPQIMHVHNTLPLVSPAAYYAGSLHGVPVIQTLHNYRLFCANGLFFREGRVCEDCVGHPLPWPGVRHRCYRSSVSASAAVVTMLAIHRAIGTYKSRIDRFIALTQFSKMKFVECGLPSNKISVKPNFVAPDPGVGNAEGGYGLFVGRLSQEKGLETLLTAIERIRAPIKFVIVGDGPMAPRVIAATNSSPNISWLGQRPVEDIYEVMGRALFLVFPSALYENFPRVAAEAFAKGTPIIAAKIGAMSEIVNHSRTGLFFEPGDPDDLASQMKWMLGHPDKLTEMRRNARTEFETKYTARANYDILMRIYETASTEVRDKRVGRSIQATF